MKFEKKLKNDLAKIKTPEIERILPGATAEAPAPRASRAKKPVGVTALAVILCCCMVLGVAAAATVPLIRKIINDKRIIDNAQQLTVVPEGYVGIYTKQDLLALDGSSRLYILMEDITFTDADYAPGGILEGGFRPLRPGAGNANVLMFNGNGHVIRNLKFAENEDGRYGLFGGGVNSIINLGIEGCEINATLSCAPGEQLTPLLYAGAVAASAEFIGACYVDGLTVNVECDLDEISTEVQTSGSIIVGGIGGHVRYVDSCYVNNASITVGGVAAPALTPWGSRNEVCLSVGGIVGEAHSCVTSWFSGKVSNNVAGEFFRSTVHDITEDGVSDAFPILMTEEQYDGLMARMEEKLGTDSFEGKKFNAYYVKLYLDNATAEEELLFEQLNNMTAGQLEGAAQRVWYLFDLTASYIEKTQIYELLMEIYNGDKEAIAQLCRDVYVAGGVTDCYTLDLSRPLTAEDVPGLDLEAVWTIRDGKPVQRVFDH